MNIGKPKFLYVKRWQDFWLDWWFLSHGTTDATFWHCSHSEGIFYTHRCDEEENMSIFIWWVTSTRIYDLTRKSFQKSDRKSAMSVLGGVEAYGGSTHSNWLIFPDWTLRGHIAIAPSGSRIYRGISERSLEKSPLTQNIWLAGWGSPWLFEHFCNVLYSLNTFLSCPVIFQMRCHLKNLLRKVAPSVGRS